MGKMEEYGGRWMKIEEDRGWRREEGGRRMKYGGLRW